jgi:hypothetical protein
MESASKKADRLELSLTGREDRGGRTLLSLVR